MIIKCLQAAVCLLMFVPGACLAQQGATKSTSFAPAETAKSKAIEDQLAKMTEEVLAVEVRRDLPAMDRFFTDNYTHTHAVGLIESKASFMASFNPGPRRYKEADLSEIKVRYFGTSAIVSGHERIGADGGDHHYSFLAVWVQEQGKWRLGAWVTSAIPKQRP